VGAFVGVEEGANVGFDDSSNVVALVVWLVGENDGNLDGSNEGIFDGRLDGNAVGTHDASEHVVWHVE
jgi:hypothetical protein